jgi:hypothetical protein
MLTIEKFASRRVSDEVFDESFCEFFAMGENFISLDISCVRPHDGDDS